MWLMTVLHVNILQGKVAAQLLYCIVVLRVHLLCPFLRGDVNILQGSVGAQRLYCTV